MTEQNKDQSRELNKNNPDANADPITGTHGSHPVGTGIGAAVVGIGGAAAGAATGAVVGAVASGPAAPIGGVIGAVVGAVAGGFVGKEIAEQIHPTRENAYWSENYKHQPYVANDSAAYTYEQDYQPAYRYGWESRAQHPGKQWIDVQEELSRGWQQYKGTSRLDWYQASAACHDAWNRCTPDAPQDYSASDELGAQSGQGPSA